MDEIKRRKDLVLRFCRRILQKIIDQEVQGEDEITEIGGEQVTKVIEKQHEELIM